MAAPVKAGEETKGCEGEVGRVVELPVGKGTLELPRPPSDGLIVWMVKMSVESGPRVTVGRSGTVVKVVRDGVRENVGGGGGFPSSEGSTVGTVKTTEVGLRLVGLMVWMVMVGSSGTVVKVVTDGELSWA